MTKGSPCNESRVMLTLSSTDHPSSDERWICNRILETIPFFTRIGWKGE